VHKIWCAEADYGSSARGIHVFFPVTLNPVTAQSDNRQHWNAGQSYDGQNTSDNKATDDDL
jgi:hypothetical protein